MGIFDRIGQKIGDLVEDLSVDPEVGELLTDARRAYEAGDFADAARLAERVIRAEHEHVRAWTLLGLSNLRLERFSEARVAFERALSLRPDDPSTMALLARTQYRDGDEVAAIETAKRALTGKVDRDLLDDFYGLLGEIFLRRGDAERAVRELRKAVAATGGEDLRLVGLLGCALADEGNDTLAAHHLGLAAAGSVPDLAVLKALVEVLLRLDRVDEALLAALRLVEASPRDVEGACFLAKAQLAGGEPTKARETLLRALEVDATRAEPHRLLAATHAAIGDASIALEHLRVALGRAHDDERPELLAEEIALCFDQLPLFEVPPSEDHAAEVAEDEDPILAALGHAAVELMASRPEDPLALAGVALARRQDEAEAMRLATQSLAARETFEGRLALAALFEGGGQEEAAVTALRAALRLRPSSPVARAHLRAVFRRRHARDLEAIAADGGLYPTFARVETLLAAQPATSRLAPRVARIRHDLDSPLLIAVMGEFNTGKSTFVNALIGEEIAPMGITPTTATINVLKYGEARAARVVWRDDREELLPWSEVGDFLRKLDPLQAREIRLVELLEPSEALARVNVVDTPGLNSIVEEHEATAREFLDEADAVIWLFAADQAGKETEELALKMLARQELKTVGVINKVDRLTPEELARVVSHLDELFGDRVEAMLPVSAKRALDARRRGDDAALDASRFPALRAFLDARFFSRSRRLKREAARRRLRELAGEGRDRIVALLEVQAQRRVRLDDVRRGLVETWGQDERLEDERRQLQRAFEEVFLRGAEEVLDFVRPRPWRLGSHQVDPADRDFLLDLLTDGFRQLADDSQRRLLGALADRGERLLGGMDSAESAGVALIERVLGEERALLTQQVYERFFAFARGFLSGGRIDDFVTRRLPDLELDLDAIAAALATDTSIFMSEILDPLRAWDSACLLTLREVIDELEREVLLVELELEATARDPLTQLERELAGELLVGEVSAHEKKAPADVS